MKKTFVTLSGRDICASIVVYLFIFSLVQVHYEKMWTISCADNNFGWYVIDLWRCYSCHSKAYCSNSKSEASSLCNVFVFIQYSYTRLIKKKENWLLNAWQQIKLSSSISRIWFLNPACFGNSKISPCNTTFQRGP